MKALGDHHGEDRAGVHGSSETSNRGIAGRFFARLWDLDCVLELQLDSAGRINGSFMVDGERLEITGGSPGARGEVCGVIGAHNLAESFAGFKAKLDEDGLFLEMDATANETAPETVTRVIFVRIG